MISQALDRHGSAEGWKKSDKEHVKIMSLRQCIGGASLIVEFWYKPFVGVNFLGLYLVPDITR
jgi:hypothetical protein